MVRRGNAGRRRVTGMGAVGGEGSVEVGDWWRKQVNAASRVAAGWKLKDGESERSCWRSRWRLN